MDKNASIFHYLLEITSSPDSIDFALLRQELKKVYDKGDYFTLEAFKIQFIENHKNNLLLDGLYKDSVKKCDRVLGIIKDIEAEEINSKMIKKIQENTERGMQGVPTDF